MPCLGRARSRVWMQDGCEKGTHAAEGTERIRRREADSQLMMEPGGTEPTSVWDLGSGRPWACFKSGDLITPKSCHKSEQDVTNLWMIIELFIYLFIFKKTLCSLVWEEHSFSQATTALFVSLTKFILIPWVHLRSGVHTPIYYLWEKRQPKSCLCLESCASVPQVHPLHQPLNQHSCSPSSPPSSFGCTPEPHINKDWAATPGLQRLTPVPVKSFSNILFKNIEQRTGTHGRKRVSVRITYTHMVTILVFKRHVELGTEIEKIIYKKAILQCYAFMNSAFLKKSILIPSTCLFCQISVSLNRSKAENLLAGRREGKASGDCG